MSIEDVEKSPRIRRSPAVARANILAAAEAILVAQGPQALKLVDVAKAAGVANASVLHHFGSIDDVQKALMETMIDQLIEKVLAVAIRNDAPGSVVSTGVAALFDAFEGKGASRLAAWLELTGESRRLTVVREAVTRVVQARRHVVPALSVELIEDFVLLCITMALGVGLFGATLEDLLNKPQGKARDLALGMIQARVETTILSVSR